MSIRQQEIYFGRFNFAFDRIYENVFGLRILLENIRETNELSYLKVIKAFNKSISVMVRKQKSEKNLTL